MNQKTQGMKGLGFIAQLGIGMWLSFGVMAGIESKSWGPFFGPALIGLFFLVSMVSLDATRAAGRAIQNAGRIALTLCALLFAVALLLGIERLYLLHGSTYPRFLAHDLGAVNYQRLLELDKNECKGHGPTEIIGKSNGVWVLRCGDLWTDGHTFISSTNPFADFQGYKQ
jgi:hypothetical protein